MTATHSNPLSAYFRTPKLYTTIPSGGKFYDSSVMEMPPTGELAVFPMTTKDEVFLKNPDALLNGEAVCNLITSCVPSVKDARQLYTVDVDTLLVAIRGASSGDSVDASSTCPECNHNQEFAVSIEAALSQQVELKQLYEFELENGLVLTLAPLTYGVSIQAGIDSFQYTRGIQNISEIQDDMKRLRAFNDSFVKMADLNFQLLAESIQSIKIPQADEIITDKKHIREFVESCDNNTGRALTQHQKSITDSGIQNQVTVTCEQCSHQYDTPINFDPVTFFTAS